MVLAPLLLDEGAASSSTDLPILPPIWASKPQAFNMCPTSAVVVDLPLVPVMAITGALPGLSASVRISRAKRSTSPITGTLAALACSTTPCGWGWVSGTPGDSTRAAIFSHGHVRQGVISAPSWPPRSRAALSSSHAITCVPPATSERTAPSPVRARPKTATVLLAKARLAIILSPQLQGCEAKQGQHHRHDPEADHDGGLGPAQLLVMMMDRGHAEDALAGELERDHLHHHRHGLDHEQSAHQRQHDLVLDGDGDDTQ